MSDPAPTCIHIWTRQSTGSGTSPQTTTWGPTTCINCGATYKDDAEFREAIEAEEQVL